MTVEYGSGNVDSKIMISGYAPASPCLSWRKAANRMGGVERMIAAYFIFCAASMLCFGALTFLSLLP